MQPAIKTVDINIGYERRDHFVPFHMRTQRWSCIVAHRRAGKTVACIADLVDAALRCDKPNGRFAYVAPTYGQSKDIAWSYLKQYTAAIPGVEQRESELIVNLPANKARIRLYGADNYDRMRGIYLDGVVMDEIADIDPRAWSEVIRPALSDRAGWAVFIGTPKGRNRFWDMWKQANKSDEWFALQLKASETGLISDNELASARATLNPSQYAQEYECFPAGTMVATSRGNVPIQSVRMGDTVLTHRCRWRPVTATMARRFTGELCTIKAFGNKQPIRCTPEHPFLVYEKETASRRWVKAADVKEGDCLLLPKYKAPKPCVSEDMARLIAWFVCEGGVSGNMVSFSLNPNDEAEIERVQGLLASEGLTARWQSGSLVVNSVAFGDRLVAWCGSGAANKHIPFDVIAGHEEAFFAELMLGDGCSWEPVKGSHRWSYTTISRALALDVQLLAGTLGRRAGIVAQPSGTALIQGRTVNTSDKYLVQIPKGTKVNHGRERSAFPTKLGIAYRVRSVGTELFDGEVFNLSVKQDESYVADGRAVHNCDFTAAVVGAYYGEDLQLADTEQRITQVPWDRTADVITAWDLGIGDQTAIWFAQVVGRELHLIDYYEASGQALDHYVQVIKSKPYVYTEHLLPHDAQARELGTGKTRQEVLQQLGIQPTIVKNHSVDDGINAVRLALSRCWFDSEKTERGVDCLRLYRAERDEKNDVFKSKPVHDWASHGADAFRYLIMGLDEQSGRNVSYPKRDMSWVV